MRVRVALVMLFFLHRPVMPSIFTRDPLHVLGSRSLSAVHRLDALFSAFAASDGGAR